MNAHSAPPVNRPGRSTPYLNGVLTVIAALLVMILVQMTIGLPSAPMAEAQPGSAGSAFPAASGLANPADQRREMIAELRRISTQLDTLSGRFAGDAVKVEVVKMPKEGD